MGSRLSGRGRGGIAGGIEAHLCFMPPSVGVEKPSSRKMSWVGGIDTRPKSARLLALQRQELEENAHRNVLPARQRRHQQD